MSNEALFHFLPDYKTDKQKWDNCVSKSDNGLIYARTFYLDNTCKSWKGLIGENYDWVFPICDNKKYAISYLYQPPFSQQFGAFAKPGVTVPYKQIINLLQKHYNFWEMNFNYSTPTNIFPKQSIITNANNYVLNLSDGYKKIENNYHKDLIKNLKRSNKFNHTYQATTNYKLGIDFYKKYYSSRILHLQERDYTNFQNVCKEAQKQNMLVCRQVLNEQSEISATVILFFDGRRLYNIMNTTTATGRETQANHYLLDAVIQEFSGQDIILDFEGSDLPGVMPFYENFGTVNQSYFQVKYNNLPWPLKLFKH